MLQAFCFFQNVKWSTTLTRWKHFFQVTDACKRHGGFYLGSIGGPAAILAQNNIKKVEVLEYPELGQYVCVCVCVCVCARTCVDMIAHAFVHAYM